MRTRLAATCSAMLEVGWLFALVLTPFFFNIFSTRSFEPDKLTLLRSITLIMCVAWIIRWVEQYSVAASTGKDSDGVRAKPYMPILRYILDTPCVLAVLLFLLSYAFSTIISIFPRISFFGSFSRLQGLYTFFSYGVIFFILIDTMREREQVERFFKTMVFVSVPIAFYGILQHYQIDPIPWSTAGNERISGANMGNPIFVAAYLIMVVPVTVSMFLRGLMERLREKKPFSWVEPLIYGLIAITQIICIIYTQSRGPWIGLLAGFFIFFMAFLILVARTDQDSSKLARGDILKAFLFAIGGMATGFFPAYVYFFVKKKGYRWLWIGFVFQTIIVAALLFTLNLPNTPLRPLTKIPYISRLGELSHRSDSGTTRVRILIWEGTVDLIRSNPFRMIVGYGPESMKHVWDPFSPPELAQHESKSAAPDRAHNETFDRIVTTGFIGLFLYVALMWSIFYFGFRWVGLIATKLHRYLFHILLSLGCIIGAVAPRFALGSFAFSGLGLSFGLIGAVAIYLMAAPFTRTVPGGNDEEVGNRLLILGLVAGIAAHFLEIHFGIAIAVTRLYFFSFAASIIVLGTKRITQIVPNREPVMDTASINASIQKNQPRKRKAHDLPRKHADKKGDGKKSPASPFPQYLVSKEVMTYALLAGLIISCIVFSFTPNSKGERDTLSIMLLSLTGQQQNFAPLMVIIVAYLSGFLLVLDSVWRTSRKEGKKGNFALSIGIYTATALAIYLIYSGFHASFVKPGIDVSGIITFFFIYVFLLALATGHFLMPQLHQSPGLFCKTKHVWFYAVLFLLSIWVIVVTNIDPVKADIYLKLGQANERNYRWNEAIRLVNQAIDTSPDDETFYLNLGRILFGKANSSNDLAEKNAVFERIRVTMEKAHALNSMNTDHIANLGLLYLRWAEFDPVPESRKEKLRISSSYFRKAIERSPKKTIIINNWARVFAAEGNFDEAIKKLNQSLAYDNTFAGTYVALGDIYGMLSKPREALQAYEKAVMYDPLNADATAMLGLMYFKEGRVNDALDLTRKAVELRPTLMKAHSLLGLIYFRLGRFQEAIDANRKVLSMRPSDLGAHRNLVILYDKMGRRDIAIKHLESAIQYAPPQERPQLEQILQYMKSGKTFAPKGS